MKRVILESPYKGFILRNEAYARFAAYDCIKRGESPYASHLLCPQFLNDEDEFERQLGINAGFEWRIVAEYSVFYCDFGFSNGMIAALKDIKARRLKYQFRAFWIKIGDIKIPEV